MGDRSASNSLAAGHRQFYTLPVLPNLASVDSAIYRISSAATRSSVSEDIDETAHRGFTNKEDFFNYINKSVIGHSKVFCGVFGDRKVVYCDYIASGRSLSFIEDFIYNEVLPDYGNTHTTTSVTSLQTTMYRHEAKDIVRNATRSSDYDAVFFVGSGCTGAVHKLIHNLHLDNPPIVIVGPFEHHSNMLPWRHMAAKIVRLNTDASGNVSMRHLKEVLEIEELEAKNSSCSLIACLAAASNVTGILIDVDKFSALVHRHNGLVFWDYATAAPYVKIDMNPIVSGPDRDLVYKDAVYFSMHKFVGGVQTPGVLIAKRVLFRAGECYPDGCGGGSVCFVSRKNQVYLQDVEEREDGGTPAIVESIRAGLVMQLKEAVTADVIVAREEEIVQRAWQRLSESNNMLVLGGDKAPRLPIFSIVVRHVFPEVTTPAGVPTSSAPVPTKPSERRMFLHHAFVAALLNDLFGVQCRSGCACAGPYAMDLLGIDEDLAKRYEAVLVKSGTTPSRTARGFDDSAREVLRPGFTRFSIPYFMSDEEANFVLEAVCFVADYGWAFLPLYTFDAVTGEWKHRRYDHAEDRQWLGHIKYTQEGMVWRRGKPKARGPLPHSFKDCLLAAKIELKHAIDFLKSPSMSPVPDDTATFDEASRKLRWFLLPCEAAAQIRGEIHQLDIPTGPSSPWNPGTMDPCTNTARQESTAPTTITAIPNNTAVVGNKHLSPRVKASPPSRHFDRAKKATTPSTNSSLPVPVSNASPQRHNRNSSGTRSHPSTSTGASPPSRKAAPSSNNHPLPQHQSRQRTGNSLRSQPPPPPPPPQASPRQQTQALASPSLSTTTTTAAAAGQAFLEETKPAVVVSAHLPRQRNNNFEEFHHDGDDGTDLTANTNTNNSVEVICRRPPSPTTRECTGDKHYEDVEDEEELKSVLVGLKDLCVPATGTKKKTGQRELDPRVNKRNDSSLWKKSIKELYKPFIKAIKDFDMIRPGDRLLICVSGGKDSLSLLHCLHAYQQACLRNSDYPSFTMGAITVDPGSSAFDPRPLIPYFADLGVEYLYEVQDIIGKATELGDQCASVCSFCSRMKRGRIYAAALKHGYNVITLGQHLDDLAESFVMSCFHNGALNTMKAHYSIRAKNLRVIRPLVYVREKITRVFAEMAGLPIIPENCPACFQMPKERMRVKRVLGEYESTFPNLYSSLQAAMLPLVSRGSALGHSGFEDARNALLAAYPTDGNKSDDEKDDLDDIRPKRHDGELEKPKTPTLYS